MKCWDNVTMKHLGLYLEKEYLSSLNAAETKLLFQELRIVNSLEFWLRLQLKIKKEESKIFDLRNRIEIYFVAISTYNEAVKEFTHNMADELLKQNISKDLKNKISTSKNRYSNWKEDDFLKVTNSVRNEISFHLRGSVYKEFLKDGQAETDLLIGIATSNKIIDFCFTEPYTFIFSKIASLCPKNVKKEDSIDWIHNEIISEISLFVKLLRDIIKEQIKGNCYKKYIEIDNAI